MYERILVPTDGSSCARVATGEAIALAQQFGATLSTVYVVDAGALPGTVDVGYVNDSLEVAGERAVEEVRRRAEEAGVEVSDAAVVYGRPHRAIVEYAQDHDVELIVMGTHGRRGFDRYLLGSVTEKVVRTADVPVLTIKGASEDAEEVPEDAEEAPEDVEGTPEDER